MFKNYQYAKLKQITEQSYFVQLTDASEVISKLAEELNTELSSCYHNDDVLISILSEIAALAQYIADSLFSDDKANTLSYCQICDSCGKTECCLPKECRLM